MSTQIADSDYGVLSYSNGEVLNDAKVADPTAYRCSAREGKSLGKFSGDRIAANGSRIELVLDQFKEDERYPMAGERTLHLRVPNGAPGGDEGKMNAIYTVRYDGIQYHVPIIGAQTPPSNNSRFYSSDGRYCFNVQGDAGGKIVQYDTHGSTDEAQWTPCGEIRAILP